MTQIAIAIGRIAQHQYPTERTGLGWRVFVNLRHVDDSL